MLIQTQILLTTPIAPSPRVHQLLGLFDIPPATVSQTIRNHRFTLPESWNIGVIVGPSGAGKSTLARQIFPDSLAATWPWPTDRSIVDAFPAGLGIRDVTSLLCSVGFSSPPAWLRPFAALSTGEQFRVHLARTLAEMPAMAVVDEFSSTIDRTAACIGSAAAAKAVRARGQKFVAVTCHYDVLDWLRPDWIYEPHTGQFTLNTSTSTSGDGGTSASRLLRRRPPIELEIARVHRSAWSLFAPHHYLSGDLHRSSQCYAAFYAGRAAAFVAALPFPHPKRPGWREHRCVCLPEFQGVGIGNAISEFVAAEFAARGKRYTSTTSHPGMIAHRLHCPRWRLIRKPALTSRHQGIGPRRACNIARLTASFEYVKPP